MDDFNSEAGHLKPSAIPPSKETMSRGTGPVDLLHFHPRLRGRRIAVAVVSVRRKRRWGFLWNPELPEGFWQCATLTCQ